MATGAWQIIGFFGSSAVDDIPKVMPAAVLDPTGRRVVSSDVADSEGALREAESFALERFHECVAEEAATPLEPPVVWQPGSVMLLVNGAIERVSVEEAEARLNSFVRQQRAAGEAALDSGRPGLALECFDRARRVSAEPEDIERVLALEPDPVLRAIIRAPLSKLR